MWVPVFFSLLCDLMEVTFPVEASIFSSIEGEGLVRHHYYRWNYIPYKNLYVEVLILVAIESDLFRK